MSDAKNLQHIIHLAGDKADVEALSGNPSEIVFGHATDTDEIGIYNGSVWKWFGAVGSGSATSGYMPSADGSGGVTWLDPRLTLIPYTGATADVDLGAHQLTLAGPLTIGPDGSNYARLSVDAYGAAILDGAGTGASWLIKNKTYFGAINALDIGEVNLNHDFAGTTSFYVSNYLADPTASARFVVQAGKSDTSQPSFAFGYKGDFYDSGNALAGYAGHGYAEVGGSGSAEGLLLVASQAGSYTEVRTGGRTYDKAKFRASNYEGVLLLDNVTVANIGSLGTEKVADGDFVTNPDTNWTWGSHWAQDTTNHTAVHTPGSAATLEQNISAVVGETYLVSYQIKNRTVSYVGVKLGGVNGVLARGYNIVHYTYITAATTGNLIFTPSSTFDGAITNVSVKKITGGNLNVIGYITGGGASGIKVNATGVLLPVQAATASAPAYVKGGLYFDTTLNKLRVGGNSGWETITSV